MPLPLNKKKVKTGKFCSLENDPHKAWAAPKYIWDRQLLYGIANKRERILQSCLFFCIFGPPTYTFKLTLPSLAKPSFVSFSIQAMLCHSITSLLLFKSHYYHTSPSPSSSSLSSSPSSSMSCSNSPLNFSRKPRMSIRQIWRRTTLTSTYLPSQNASPLLPLRVNPQSSSSPSHNPLRNQMINQLYNISSILESQAQNSPNAYSHAPPSPLIHPPTNAQVEFHSSFCHCCSWKILLDQFQSKLSSWKGKSPFHMGRLTLIKAVLGSRGIYFLLIFKAPDVSRRLKSASELEPHFFGECSLIIKLELVLSCLINCDLEPLSLDLELLEIINLASSCDHLVILRLLAILCLWTNMLIL
ncbi:hypothetical protein Tco_1376271 [Tanacetum coccineum]